MIAAAALTCGLIATAIMPVVIRRRQSREPAVNPSPAAAPPARSLPAGPMLPETRPDKS